jgi:hypothetical protein
MKRSLFLVFIAVIAAACSSSTAVAPARYNFKVVSGLNQVADAGSPRLGSIVTAKLTTAPDGQFAARNPVLDFFMPKVAFAQSITVKGAAVVGGVVCAPIPKAGEPTPFSICTNTLADGTAPFAYTPGTKAGTYNLKFVAQTATTSVVTDSTTLTVNAGPADPNFHLTGNPIVSSPAILPVDAVRDAFGNAVQFRVVADVNLVVSDTTTGTVNARTLTFKDSIDPNGTNGVAELRGAGNILVGHLGYRIYPAGSYAQPSLTWSSAGTALTP